MKAMQEAKQEESINKEQKLLFKIKGRFNNKARGFILEINLDKKLREYLKGYLNTTEVVKSDSWISKEQEFLRYYKGGFNLNTLFSNLGLSSCNGISDSFGNRNISNNIGVLRSKELLDYGKVNYLFAGFLFSELKNLSIVLVDFLIRVSKGLDKGVINIKGYETKHEIKELIRDREISNSEVF